LAPLKLPSAGSHAMSPAAAIIGSAPGAGGGAVTGSGGAGLPGSAPSGLCPRFARTLLTHLSVS
jgi:hypothetical protein